MNRIPLPRNFYDRHVVRVARELLGKLLLRRTSDGQCAGRIVEVEAYLADDDSACHAYRGRTRRNATMFGPPGRAYVYAIHSRYCMNVVTEPEGVASAVLIRALEPLEGIDSMKRRRGTDELLDLARGPARLCEALQVDRNLDGWELTRGEELWIADDPHAGAKDHRIGVSTRIGVTSAQDLPLRFFFEDNRFVSGSRRGR